MARIRPIIGDSLWTRRTSTAQPEEIGRVSSYQRPGKAAKTTLSPASPNGPAFISGLKIRTIGKWVTIVFWLESSEMLIQEIYARYNESQILGQGGLGAPYDQHVTHRRFRPGRISAGCRCTSAERIYSECEWFCRLACDGSTLSKYFE
jgi:hypothetical protein